MQRQLPVDVMAPTCAAGYLLHIWVEKSISWLSFEKSISWLSLDAASWQICFLLLNFISFVASSHCAVSLAISGSRWGKSKVERWQFDGCRMCGCQAKGIGPGTLGCKLWPLDKPVAFEHDIDFVTQPDLPVPPREVKKNSTTWNARVRPHAQKNICVRRKRLSRSKLASLPSLTRPQPHTMVTKIFKAVED